MIKAQGDAEWEKEKARCFIKKDGIAKKVLDDFETPYEDNVLRSERSRYANIIVDDGKGGIQIL